MAWMALYREYIIQYVIEHKKYPNPIPSDFDLVYVLRTVPYHCQLGIHRQLGTSKLATVIESKIQDDQTNKTSNVESYLSIAFYSDIKGSKHREFLKKFVKKVGGNVVRDYLLYKIRSYYYRRTNPGSTSEKFYLDLLVELRIRSLGLPARMKERVQKSIEDGKKLFLGSPDAE
jgi:hypothetical protein